MPFFANRMCFLDWICRSLEALRKHLFFHLGCECIFRILCLWIYVCNLTGAEEDGKEGEEATQVMQRRMHRRKGKHSCIPLCIARLLMNTRIPSLVILLNDQCLGIFLPRIVGINGIIEQLSAQMINLMLEHNRLITLSLDCDILFL